MKKFLVILLVLGLGFAVIAKDKKEDNPTYRKNDDTAAKINMGLGTVSAVDSTINAAATIAQAFGAKFRDFTITGMIKSLVKKMFISKSSEANSKATNCPRCATALATASTGGPEDPAYEGAYTSFLLACQTFVPVVVDKGPHTEYLFEDQTCPTCIKSIGQKWPPILVVAPDVMGLIVSGVKLATTQFLQDANKVIAQLIGDAGHVTDKWVGPPSRNKIIETMGENIAVASHAFGSLSFDAKEYEGIKVPEKASRRELFEYRSKQIAEDQRSLKNVTQKNLRLIYRAQQRSIKALTRAMELKKQLNVLADVDAKIDAKYDNLPSSLAAEASRRALYGALTQLKLSVVAARVKTRSEALELEFKPMVKQTEGVKLATGDAGATDGGSQ